MKKLLKNNYLILFTLISFIFLTMCFFKNIYPFGIYTLDYSDGGQQMVPLYHHLWDVFNNAKSLNFDFLTGFGTNMSGNIIFYGLISPLNLLLLFIKRNNIQNYFTYFILIRLILMSFSINYFLNKHFKNLSQVLIITFSLIYVFNGYVFNYYIFLNWLEMAIIFPLLMDGVISLFNDENITNYILFLALSLVISVNLAIMNIMFIIIYAFLYINFITKKEDKSRISLKLATASIIAILIASFLFIPGIINILESKRANNNLIEAIKFGYTFINFTDPQKWSKIICLPLCIILTLFNLPSLEKNNKNFKVFFILFCVVILPIIVEGSNIFWHLGPYSYFSIRFGYIINFLAIMIASSNNHKKIKLNIIVIIFNLILIIVLFLNFKYKNHHLWYANYLNFNIFIITCFLLTIIIFIKLNTKFIFLVTVISCAIFSFYNLKSLNPLTSFESPVYDANSLSVLQNKQLLSRIKNYDYSLNNNYPLILERSSISSYLQTSKKQADILKNLGYSESWIRLFDNNGTLLSDMFFNFTDIVSYTKLPEELYKFNDKINNFYIYEPIYKLPLGITINNDFKDIKLNKTAIENQGIFAEKLYNDDNIYEYIFFNHTISDEMDISINEPSIIYYESWNNGHLIKLNLNGSVLKIPNLKNNDNEYYPADYSNGIINLGVFDKDVKLKIEHEDNAEFYVNIAILKLSKLSEIVSNHKNNSLTYKITKNKLEINFNNISNDKYLVLPVFADKGFILKVNKKYQNIIPLFDSFMMIPIENDNNAISLTFYPKGQNIGIFLSISGFILLLYFNKFHKKLCNVNFINNLSFYLLNLIGILIFIFMVILPLFIFIKIII